MARGWLALALGGAWGAAAGAAPEPPPAELDPDELEPDESPPPRGTPLTRDELAAFERVMGLHEEMLGTLERHRASAPAATRALNALADRNTKVLDADARTLATIKKRIVDEDDQAASLSIPDALLQRIDQTAGRWLALLPDVERLLAHEPFGDAMMRFAIPLL
ncbi:MAG: hypothetical protein IT385_05385 [Deltaproteobacteria bacterium]|nr:hypothetical protein [Deltaproteobacteria bacterium]